MELALAIATAIGSLFAIILYSMNRRDRINAEKRKIADEAENKLKNAKTKSDHLDAWDIINRV